MAEWVDEGDSTYTLTVGSMCATVQPYTSESFEWRIRSTDTHDTLKRWEAPLPLDAAKAAAEQALREMHDALAAHFAPVLRWERITDDDGTRDVAMFGPLLLKAERFGWRVVRASDGHIVDFGIVGGAFDLPFDDGIKAARDRCAKSLRSLGVVFRTEGER